MLQKVLRCSFDKLQETGSFFFSAYCSNRHCSLRWCGTGLRICSGLTDLFQECREKQCIQHLPVESRTLTVKEQICSKPSCSKAPLPSLPLPSPPELATSYSTAIEQKLIMIQQTLFNRIQFRTKPVDSLHSELFFFKVT